MNIIVITISSLLTLSQLNQDASEKIISSIDSALSSVAKVSCSYTCSRTVSLLKETVTSEGSVHIDLQNSVIKWTKRSPEHTEMVFSPGDVQGTSVNQDNKQIYKKISRYITSGTSSKGFADQSMFDRTVSSGDGKYVVRMIPKSRDTLRLFSLIDLTFDSISLILKEIRMTDEEGDITVISIHSVKTEK